MTSEKRIELIGGILLAFLATILSIVDLAGGKYGDDEIIAINEKASAFQWYQSKSIKETSVEMEKELLATLLGSGAIEKTNVDAMENFEKKLDSKLKKYQKEKEEILKGSAAVGKANWVQAKDGEMGKIIGAEEWAKKAEILGRAGDYFDLSVLFFHISLVLGAVSLVIEQMSIKKIFMVIMVILGILGIYFGYEAYHIALTAG